MDTCKVRPDSANFSGLAGQEAIAIMLDGGGPRVRRDQLGAVYTYTVQWTGDGAMYDYLLAFYRTSTDFGSTPFLCPLIVDNHTVSNYQAWIVPGSWKPVAAHSGLAFTVSCQLWVVPTNDTSGDAAIIAAYPA